MKFTLEVKLNYYLELMNTINSVYFGTCQIVLD